MADDHNDCHSHNHIDENSDRHVKWDSADSAIKVIQKINYYFLFVQCIGIAIELIFLYVMFRNWCMRITVLKSTFFYLLTLKTVNNLIYIILVIMIGFWWEELKNYYNQTQAMILSFIIEIDTLCQFAIAVNRFTALMTPLKHKRIWSPTVTFSVLAIIPCLSVLLAYVHIQLHKASTHVIASIFESHQIILVICSLILVFIPVMKDFCRFNPTNSNSISATELSKMTSTNIKKQTAEKQLLYETIFVCFWKTVNIFINMQYHREEISHFDEFLFGFIIDVATFIGNVGGLLVLPCVSSVARKGFKQAFGIQKNGNNITVKKALAANPKDPTTCQICKLVIEGVRIMVAQNKTEEEIDKFVIDICVNFKIEQPYVCKTIVNDLRNELYFVVEYSILEPHEFCGIFIKNCSQAINPLDQPWPLHIPENKPAVKPWPIPEPGKPTMRVLHLADIHIDRQYAVGSEADCATETGDNFLTFCCRNYPPEKDVKSPAGQFGMPQECDIPFITFEKAMEHISQQEKFDYIIITGDLEPHAIWDYTRETTAANIVNVTETILKYFPNTPVYQAVGNHEGVPSDSFAPHSIPEYDSRGPQWLYSIFNEQWGHWLPTNVKESLQYRGSYSFRPFKGLKIISLNSVYCSEFNFYLYINATDPDQTLEWLTNELLDSENKGEKAHIISHIPSGDSYCLKAWSANYYKLINRFENTIAAQFFGHTHHDHFYMYYDDANPKNRATHVAFIAPSLTTDSYLNPAYRVYTIDGDYDGSTFTVLDEDNYWVNITEANMKGELKFELEYNKKQAFGLKDMSPESFNDLLKRMLNDESLLDKYITYYFRNNVQLSTCDSKCKKEFICRAMTGEAGKEDVFCAGIE